MHVKCDHAEWNFRIREAGLNELDAWVSSRAHGFSSL